MEDSGNINEYEKFFKLDRDLNIRVKLNKPAHDITLVIAKIVRVEAGRKVVVYETGFLNRRKRKIRRKLFVRKIVKIFPFLKKIFNRSNKKREFEVRI